MPLKTEILVDGLEFPEGPRWNKNENRLYFSDIFAKKVLAVDLDGNIETLIEMKNWPSGLGFLPDGKLLIVSMQDRRLFRLDSDNLIEIADLMNLASFHCNDMVVDKRGKAYIGNLGYDAFNLQPIKPAEIILVMPDGKARIVADNMIEPNGTVITPDEKTLIVAETRASRLTAFDIIYDGSLKNRRVWANLDNSLPDGICLDVEGAIWVANFASSEVIRVLEGGKITDRIKVSTNAFACALGGLNRRILFICTSDYFDRLSTGRIEMIKVDVPGAGLP